MDFYWNDGGRAACGFVGSCGDCITRALAIGTGISYRAVYDELGSKAQKSPRSGLPVAIAANYLKSRGWHEYSLNHSIFEPLLLPKGVVIVHLFRESRRFGHLTTLIDQVIHDTWNPAEDEYLAVAYWQAPQSENQCQNESRRKLTSRTLQTLSPEQELTQQEFEKILRRLRALDKTASNHASTEGEKRNALRMLQTLLLQHNLTRDDISPHNNTDLVQFARMSCFLNSTRACNWEYSLAAYLTKFIFPMVQYYANRHGHRTRFQFYGPRQDTQNCLELFRELLLTVASSATLRFGGYTRGSGASYAEGYVTGLPKGDQPSDSEVEGALVRNDTHQQLILNRVMILRQDATRWLRDECGVRLSTSTGSGRVLNDPLARGLGKQHGATHIIRPAQQPKRIN